MAGASAADNSNRQTPRGIFSLQSTEYTELESSVWLSFAKSSAWEFVSVSLADGGPDASRNISPGKSVSHQTTRLGPTCCSHKSPCPRICQCKTADGARPSVRRYSPRTCPVETFVADDTFQRRSRYISTEG